MVHDNLPRLPYQSLLALAKQQNTATLNSTLPVRNGFLPFLPSLLLLHYFLPSLSTHNVDPPSLHLKTLAPLALPTLPDV